MLVRSDDLVKPPFLSYTFYFLKINLEITASVCFLELLVIDR